MLVCVNICVCVCVCVCHTDDPRPFEEELKQREATLGPAHPDVAESCSNLATLYNQKGDSGTLLQHKICCLPVCMYSSRHQNAELL